MWTDGLARWYVAGGRHDLPWRHTRDPWAVLVSEVMLQQTQVSRALPRWGPFMQRWPTPHSLAAAPLVDLLRAWQGLGYPRRALDLQRSAALISAAGWPRDERALRALPGVGEYRFSHRSVEPVVPEWMLIRDSPQFSRDELGVS